MSAWDKNWEKLYKKRIWAKYPHEPLIRFIAKNFYHCKNRKKIKILELGCGSGANIWYLAREGFTVYGIDASATAIRWANTFLSQDNLHAILKIGEITNLPYKDKFFDLVIDYGSLSSNNLGDLKVVLSEVKRVLKKSGLFFNETLGTKTDMVKYEEKDGFEYRNFRSGPFAGLGLVRTINRKGIVKHYGAYFKIRSMDRMEDTFDNEKYFIQKWIIVCENSLE